LGGGSADHLLEKSHLIRCGIFESQRRARGETREDF
jgi:hypothetical protein